MIAHFPFFRLPREIRDDIFDYVFDDIKKQCVSFKSYQVISEGRVRPPLEKLPPLCSVSQQFYLEATPRYLARMTLSSCSVTTTSWILKWLATFPFDSGYRSVRQMMFRNFHGPEQNKGFELISRCHNLRSLDIMLGDEFSEPGTVPSLSMKALSSSLNAYDSFDHIILVYQLHRLLDIPKLARLEFGFHDWEQPVSVERARQVKEWLRMESQAKGIRMDVVCRQMEWGTVRHDNYLFAMFGRWNVRD